MDPQRLKDAYQKLQTLDDLASYTVELKEVVQELILAIASKPPAPGS
jgi:hypothetical protein